MLSRVECCEDDLDELLPYAAAIARLGTVASDSVWDVLVEDTDASSGAVLSAEAALGRVAPLRVGGGGGLDPRPALVGLSACPIDIAALVGAAARVGRLSGASP